MIEIHFKLKSFWIQGFWSTLSLSSDSLSFAFAAPMPPCIPLSPSHIFSVPKLFFSSHSCFLPFCLLTSLLFQECRFSPWIPSFTSWFQPLLSAHNFSINLPWALDSIHPATHQPSSSGDRQYPQNPKYPQDSPSSCVCHLSKQPKSETQAFPTPHVFYHEKEVQ